MFYSYMLKQTGGEWSAPLDDVFIHFDYARATALGHPFEWTIGNGYSSGNTSLFYPFVLAAGYLIGFQEEQLMVWAAIVAAVSVFGTLLGTRKLFLATAGDSWGRFSSYLLPAALFAIGALNWSFWSGMEVAIFVATWAIALAAYAELDRALLFDPKEVGRRSWLLGLSGALMIVTRPEAVATIALFGAFAAFRPNRHGERWGRIAILFRVGLPGFVALFCQSVANRVFTGEWSANGAIVKLALNSPFLTRDEKVADYFFNLRYAALRNLEYHFSDDSRFGWLLVFLAAIPLFFERTRRVALLIWLQIGAWLALVAFNGQVRWQNERYTMPAVAWLLILAALGASEAFRKRKPRSPIGAVIVGTILVQIFGVITRPGGAEPSFRLPWLLAIAGGVVLYLILKPRPLRAALVIGSLFFVHQHQEVKMLDQKWFFGRACRNIRDQQTRLGRWLKTVNARRVLVGDAGAILYSSKLPGLDIIGLGGFHQFPFARAGVHGLPATLELIEHIPSRDRPDVLAIFPTWWGVLPTWFSSQVMRRFPVEGNVICGGYEHVAYQADWHLLNTGNDLRRSPKGDSGVVDEIDIADLISEKKHSYDFSRPANGWTDMRILADDAGVREAIFDGGRRIGKGHSERFTILGAAPTKGGHLVVRTAPEGKSLVEVRVDGAPLAKDLFEHYDGWVEHEIELPKERIRNGMVVEFINEGPDDFVDYHVWVTQ